MKVCPPPPSSEAERLDRTFGLLVRKLEMNAFRHGIAKQKLGSGDHLNPYLEEAQRLGLQILAAYQSKP